MPDNIRSHHDLKVWQLGKDIAEHVYAVTKTFPTDEKFGIISQLRRAASSIPANVAEGNGRNSTREYLQHLAYATGSLCEVETFLQLSLRLQHSDGHAFHVLLGLLAEEGRMLSGLKRSLSRRIDLSTH